MPLPRIPVVPASADFPSWCAWEILKREQDRLPDLSHVTVLLPSWTGARLLRTRLRECTGGRGLLGPTFLTLQQFAATRAADGPVMSPLECRLMLRAALLRHSQWLAGVDRSRLADALFDLFEQMSADAVTLPATERDFEALLERGYGTRPNRFLSSEAGIVHRLWQAFIDDSGGRSPAMAHRQRMARAFEHLSTTEHVYLAGFDELSRAEGSTIAAALADGRVEVWLHGRTTGRDGQALQELVAQLGASPDAVAAEPTVRSRLLDDAYGEGTAPDSLPQHPDLHIIDAPNAEAEARCVELAVRREMLAGARDLAILTQDRRLARRLRALLERAGLSLQDAAGWALSTSSAAALVDAWLECLDQRFQFRPLLEVVKSAFVAADPAAVDYLERDLVYRRRIERGLDRFLAAASERPDVADLLQKVQRASAASAGNFRLQHGHEWVAGLLQGLRELGAESQLRQDAAGMRLWALLEQMQAAFQRHPAQLDRQEFRALLGRALETETFVPEAAVGQVRLLTLEQSQNLRCDFLVVAGANRDSMPGSAPAQPLFNQAVRAELGLPDWPRQQALALMRWRRVLDSAGSVLVTYSASDVHDQAQPSPWLDALDSRARHRGLDLRDPELAALAGTAGVEIAHTTPPPDPSLRPAPVLPRARIPAELSASAHQALLDCPYRFYARYGLGLYQPDAPDEDPDRSDYGNHVHRILQAFTTAVEGLPLPFPEAVTAANRAGARARLEDIAHVQFEPEIRQRALALSWRAEFQASLPRILDWLEQRPPATSVATEVALRREAATLTLTGTIDRLESLVDGRRVVADFKTGKLPKNDEVRSGESVQLLHYAALDLDIQSAELVALKDGEKSVVLDRDLHDLRERAERRLADTLDALRDGRGLPAQGDLATCKHCDYSGICRRRDWNDV